MQTKFLEAREAVANLGRRLLGTDKQPLVSPKNRLVNSFIYGIDDQPSSHVSPNNLLVHADLVVLDELAKGDEPSE